MYAIRSYYVCQRKQALIALLGRKVRPGNDVLVYAYRTIDFTTPPKQVAEREVSFDRLVIDPNHLEKRNNFV